MTVAYYRSLLLSMLPPGAFNVEPGGVPYALATGLATVFNSAAERCQQAQAEVIPHTAEEMLAEWERMVRAPARVGASTSERQAQLVARWRYAIGLRRFAMRAVLAPILQPEYAFRDACDDGDISWRWQETLGNGAGDENLVRLFIEIPVGADGRWDATHQNQYMLLQDLVDRRDHVTIEALISGYTFHAVFGDDCHGGLVLGADNEHAYMLGPYKEAGVVYVGLHRVVDNVFEMGVEKVAIPATPFWIRLDVNPTTGLVTGSYGAALGAMTSLPAIPISVSKPRRLGVYIANNGVLPATDVQFDTIQIKYGTQHNNVELLEMPLALVPAGVPEAKFYFAVHRDPADAGAYSITEAQVVVDKIKSGHTLGFVGESDCFRCDDPYSLTDRDILGS